MDWRLEVVTTFMLGHVIVTRILLSDEGSNSFSTSDYMWYILPSYSTLTWRVHNAVSYTYETAVWY